MYNKTLKFMYSMKSFKIYKYVNNHLQPLKKLESNFILKIKIFHAK